MGDEGDAPSPSAGHDVQPRRSPDWRERPGGQPVDPSPSPTTPLQQAPEPDPAGEGDPLAGARSEPGWLERPLVRAGLAVVLLVALVPGLKWARNALARR